jgi:hypothetical protein
MRGLERRAGNREQGQALVVAVGALAALLGFGAFAIDIGIGYAYYTQRALQASADAAALAGAQALPDAGASAALAAAYGTDGKNARDNVGAVTEQISTKCINSIPGCSPVNAVVVRETATTPTYFSRIFGFDSFTISVRSTACSPCGVKPLDVMLVFDRTLSMCLTHHGDYDASCTDLNNARDGMKEFLSLLDSERQWVGLGVFPPAPSVSKRCDAAGMNAYNSRSAVYNIVPLSKDYEVDGDINTSSNLVQTINCQRGGGITAYANALEHAQAALDAQGRDDVQDVIVFFSDGAANTGPTYYSSSSPYRRQPCRQGVRSADSIKELGTVIYSIGYDLNAKEGGGGSFNVCKSMSWDGDPETPPITASQALEDIASTSEHFHNQPNPGDLEGIFSDIAHDIRRGSAALVDDNLQ